MSDARVVQRVYEAFGRGDVPAVLARLDSAVECHLAEGHPYSPTGRTWVGHSAIVEDFFAGAGAHWDRFAIAVVDVHEAGDAVVAEVRYSGTSRPRAESPTPRGNHVWKLRDGKVTAFPQYVDTSQLQAVTGTVPAREGADVGTTPTATLYPTLIRRHADAEMEWLERALGFSPVHRDEAGEVQNAEMSLGTARVMPAWRAPTSRSSRPTPATARATSPFATRGVNLWAFGTYRP